MSLKTSSSLSLPVVAETDFVICGGSAAAVAFALAVHARGARVFLAAPRSYLGDDICAGFRYWPEADPSSNPLAKQIFSGPGVPPKPLEVKSILEQALVAAGIPFVFNTHPCGLVRDGDDGLRGVVIGNRAGRQVVMAERLVDASPEATLLRQAGVEGVATLHGEQRVQWTTLRTEEALRSPDAPEGEELPGYDLGDHSLYARRFALDLDFGDGSVEALSKARTDAIRRCWCLGTFQQQSLLLPAWEQGGGSPELADLEVAPGLIGLSESFVLPNRAHAVFADPVAAMETATRVGGEVEIPSASRSAIEGAVIACADARPVSEGEIATLREALRPLADKERTVDLEGGSSVPVLGAFDVVVVGGGTGGASAAIGSGRAGARTLVVEIASALGGVGTLGQICSYYFGNRDGFTAEIDKGVSALEVDDRLRKAKNLWSPGAKAHWYLDEGVRSGVSCLFYTACVGVWKCGSVVRGVLVSGPDGYGLIEAGQVVDATGCADIPAAAGGRTVTIGSEHVAVQGTGLPALNPGKPYNNSDHSFSDDTDVVDATAFFVSSRRKYAGAFDVGELVDSRERRQIVGERTLSATDILYERRFPDTIAVATSNFDTHGFTIDPCFIIIPPDKKTLWADVPLGSLLPVGLDGVLVTGLGVSAHRDAIPVIRMQACVQNQGYAAGYIAAQAVLNGTGLRDLDIRKIQRHLVENGCLPERVLTDEDSFPVSDEVLRTQVKEGWDDPAGVALILHEEQRSVPLLREAYQAITERNEQSLRYAQLLAFLGDASGRVELAETIAAQGWDEGWNYRGMGQFGMSMSELDGRLVALGLIAESSEWPLYFEKAGSLKGDSEFSHFRALAMAFESLYGRHPHAEAAAVLSALLDLEGLAGHAVTSIPDFFKIVDRFPDRVEDSVRNQALREIHVARVLFRCGDVEGRGEAILKAYAQDLRGHFARHARAILGEK